MTTGAIPFVEEAFGGNDIFVFVIIALGFMVIWLLPKQFESRFFSFLIISYGIVWASLFDNTIGAAPFDFYDILDGPKYTIMDVIAYLMYGPYGYFFIYIFDRFHIKGRYVAFYIILWTCFGVAFELVNVMVGVFTYKDGFTWVFSIPIYLFVQSFLLIFYKYLKG
ncbi:hypothetical protein [Bacillus pinisoli]|uniref:hypothetical protein n=1 Tax=Bacillus pinisoli TaxID=2901866 RepID=UPI001FF6CC3D|nr:hypothetical protein [Bacillus pinisoli]